MDEMVKWLRTLKVGSVVSIRGFLLHHFARFFGVVPMTATLSVKVTRKGDKVEDLGIISTHAVTDAFVAALVDTLQSSVAAFSDYKYHDSGTGTTAEAAASDFIVPGSISQKAIDEYVRHSLQADPVRADWNQQHEYNQFDATKVSMPVLLLQGEFDPLADTATHAKVFSEFPNANKQWVVLKGGDHAALLEKPRGQLIDASINFIEWLDK